MPLASPVAFPLFPVVDGKCGCGNENCGRTGKHPAVRWADLKLGDAVPAPAPGAGFGLKTGAAPKGSGVFVVDLDGPAACEAWGELEATLGAGENTPETFTVQTPRGLHLYFAHPGFHVSNSAGSLAKGVDIRGDGGFVVGPGSPHRSGGTYALAVDAPPAPAPAWLLAWLRSRPAPVEIQPHACDVTEPVERTRRRELYTKYLRDEAPPRGPERRGRGDATLFEVVQRGAYDLALPTEDVLELVREHYDPRCSPMWGDELEERVLHKANDAKTKSTRPRIEPLPADPILERLFLEPPPIPANLPRTVGAASAFHLVPASALAEPLPPVVYVVKHFGIARGRPALFAGYGGLGKTVVAQALALHIASGMDTCWGLPITPGSVLHFDYEMTREPLQRRYQRLAIGHGIELASCDLNLCSMPEIYLSDDRAEDELCRVTENVGFAIVDNLAAATASAQTGENESGIRRYLDRLTRVTAKTGCAFMVLAHERKGGKDEDGSSSPLQRVRGSSAITDACGSVVSVAASKTAGILTLAQTKASLRRGGDDVSLQIRDVVIEGMLAREGEDSPGLQIARVGALDVEKHEEALVLERQRYFTDKAKTSMLEELRKTTQVGIGARDLRALVGGASSYKDRAIAELLNEGSIIEFVHLGKKTLRIRPQ